MRRSESRYAGVLEGNFSVIRVLLVHDICLFRRALAEVLGREKDIEVTASTCAKVADGTHQLNVDVCVVDVDCTDPAWLTGLRKISANSVDPTVSDTAPAGGEGNGTPPLPRSGRRAANGAGPALLVLGSADRPGPLRRAFEAHALGYVDKEGSPARLVDGIRQVAAGKRFIDGSLGFGFLQAAEMPLTQRELSVLSLAAEGAPVAEIARVLHLSAGTVRNYMSAINRKTGARNRVDAIRISQGEGWL